MNGDPERRWYTALLVFDTAIPSDQENGENEFAYSVSAVLVSARTADEAQKRAHSLGVSPPDGAEFATGWKFSEVLNLRELVIDEPGDGTEVYSFFISRDLLDEVRRSL